MKYLISTFTLFLLSIFSYSQQIISYKTFQDYLNKNGVEEGEYFTTQFATGELIIKLHKDGKKVKFKCGSYWGFEYKGHLFRIYREAYPAMLVEQGTMFYYENGDAHLEMLANGTESGTFYNGAYCLFSMGINSEIVALPKQKALSQPYKYLKKYRKAHPELEGVIQCMEDGSFNYKSVRSCINDYNEEN